MKRLGILTALIPEAACLVDRPATGRLLPVSDGITLYVCGIGAAHAREGTRQLIGGGAEAIIGLGTAGALDPELNPGDIVVPRKILYHGGHGAGDIHAGWRDNTIETLAGAALPVHHGNLVQVEWVINTPAGKQRLHEETGAAAVDMESAAMVGEAARAGIPALVVRVIVDRADMVVPQAVVTNIDIYGHARVGALSRSLALQPWQWLALFRLARAFRIAAGRLNSIAARLPVLRPPG